MSTTLSTTSATHWAESRGTATAAAEVDLGPIACASQALLDVLNIADGMSAVLLKLQEVTQGTPGQASGLATALTTCLHQLQDIAAPAQEAAFESMRAHGERELPRSEGSDEAVRRVFSEDIPAATEQPSEDDDDDQAERMRIARVAVGDASQIAGTLQVLVRSDRSEDEAAKVALAIRLEELCCVAMSALDGVDAPTAEDMRYIVDGPGWSRHRRLAGEGSAS